MYGKFQIKIPVYNMNLNAKQQMQCHIQQLVTQTTTTAQHSTN